MQAVIPLFQEDGVPVHVRSVRLKDKLYVSVSEVINHVTGKDKDHNAQLWRGLDKDPLLNFLKSFQFAGSEKAQPVITLEGAVALLMIMPGKETRTSDVMSLFRFMHTDKQLCLEDGPACTLAEKFDEVCLSENDAACDDNDVPETLNQLLEQGASTHKLEVRSAHLKRTPFFLSAMELMRQNKMQADEPYVYIFELVGSYRSEDTGNLFEKIYRAGMSDNHPTNHLRRLLFHADNSPDSKVRFICPCVRPRDVERELFTMVDTLKFPRHHRWFSATSLLKLISHVKTIAEDTDARACKRARVTSL